MTPALVRFGYLYVSHWALRKVCDRVVGFHVGAAQPRVSTQSTLSDIALETSALAVRRLEQRCHKLKRAYEKAGREYLNGTS